MLDKMGKKPAWKGHCDPEHHGSFQDVFQTFFSAYHSLRFIDSSPLFFPASKITLPVQGEMESSAKPSDPWVWALE